MFDWQTVSVALIILAAFVYAARRAWSRLRSFQLSKRRAGPVCATGCGGCGETKEQAPPTPLLVNISPAQKYPRRTAR